MNSLPIHGPPKRGASKSRLPLDQRLETAAQLILRARIFYDLWRYYDGAETRPRIIDAMRLYSEFFRFEPHAHFVAFIVHSAALFENRGDTINLPALAKELKAERLISPHQEAEVAALLKKAAPLAKKATILRSSLFAHRSAALSYRKAFNKAAITPNELRDLTDIALKIANRLLIARGLKDHVFNPLPLNNAEAMLATLSKHEREQTG